MFGHRHTDCRCLDITSTAAVWRLRRSEATYGKRHETIIFTSTWLLKRKQHIATVALLRGPLLLATGGMHDVDVIVPRGSDMIQGRARQGFQQGRWPPQVPANVSRQICCVALGRSHATYSTGRLRRIFPSLCREPQIECARVYHSDHVCLFVLRKV